MRRTILFAFCLIAAPVLAAPISLETFIAQPQPAPDVTISYGALPVQSIDLYLPKTPGPHPVAILFHGGCWTKRIPGREQMRALGADLSKRGIVAWNIGYRRADEDGGAYPAYSRTSRRRSTCCRSTRGNIGSTHPGSSPLAIRRARIWRCGRRGAGSCRGRAPCTPAIPSPSAP
jgi:hypothetical protein